MNQPEFDFSAQASTIAGVDEVGRGPLVGDVVAAAVILDPQNPIYGLNDSKKLSEKKRNELAILIRDQAIAVSIGRASVEEIEQLNILHATMLAMKRAVDGLSVKPAFCKVDGNRIPPGLPCPAEAIVKGDSKEVSIAAASIIAKVQRDGEMKELHERHPEYGFNQHKGYGTKKHIAALEEYGIIKEHRKTFAPIRNRLNSE